MPACRMERVASRSKTPRSQNTSMLSTRSVPADISARSCGSCTSRMSCVASATVCPLQDTRGTPAHWEAVVEEEDCEDKEEEEEAEEDR